MTSQLLEMNITELSGLLERREVSPVEVTAQALERIERLNPRLNAFLTVTADLARQQARAAEEEITAGKYRGLLHGVPVAVKDLFYTHGIRTTAGSKILANFVPDFDATVVEKLSEAGAILLGKTALHEFAYGMTNDNPHFGPTRNPWNSERTPGGSSGGSGVAVATGMAFGALGTDTGGSIRIPASYCGVAGLKPTFGRVSVHGVYPLGWTLDHSGPLARTVADTAILYDAIAGFDPKDDFSVDQPVKEVRFKKRLNSCRVGVLEDYFFERVQPDVAAAVREALKIFQSLGARVDSVRLPGMFDLTEASRITLSAEAYVLHRKDLEERPGDLGGDVKTLIEKGRDVTATDYVNAQLVRYKFRRLLDEALRNVEVLIAPTTPSTAFPLGNTTLFLNGKEEDARRMSTGLTRPFNATGHPVLSVCCGFDHENMPIGMQLVGRMWDEATVLQAGQAYECATQWHKRRPPV